MKYTTIFEKIACLFDIVSDSWLYITFLAVTTILIILFCCKKISKRTCFLFITLACFIVFGFILYQYFEPISKMMNNLIEHLFTEIYFPSAYAYLFILLIINVITIGSLLNPHIIKTYKTIHGICFIMINFILTIVLEMISKNEIDIFSKKSLFSNTDFVILLEFSMNIFILWLISLLAGYIINIATERITVSGEKKNEIKGLSITPELEVAIAEEELQQEYNEEEKIPAITTTSEINSFTIDPVDTNQKHFIPEISTSMDQLLETTNIDVPEFVPQPAYSTINSSETTGTITRELDYSVLNENITISNNINQENTFDLSSLIPKKQEIKPIISNYESNQTTTNTHELFERILKNDLPLTYSESIKQEIKSAPIETDKDTYTLNDYRIFNKMLKDIREHNQSNSVQIDKNLEYRLITKYSTETYDMFKKMLKIYSN